MGATPGITRAITAKKPGAHGDGRTGTGKESETHWRIGDGELGELGTGKDLKGNPGRNKGTGARSGKRDEERTASLRETAACARNWDTDNTDKPTAGNNFARVGETVKPTR
jgi:hypothetical protein